MQWSPISKEELEVLIDAELAECTLAERKFFEQCRTPFRAASIERSGRHESVFIVAEHRALAMYYEDVEEGFNLSLLRVDDSIAQPGFEQWSLREALNQLMLAWAE